MKTLRDAWAWYQVTRGQLRRWVAHGRKTEQPPAVGPVLAYERLNRFLTDVLKLSSR